MFNKAIIPLYLNTDILNNLFTIVIQEFVEIKSVSTKDQLALHFKAPVSEFSYDIFGKYIQGDLEFVLQNEFIKQRTEEKISTTIVIFKKLKDILNEQKLLKQINNVEDFNSIEVSDFIEFICDLNPNPVMTHVDNIIKDMDIESVFFEETNTEDANAQGNAEADIGSRMKKKEKLHGFLQNSLKSCCQEKCLRYIGNCDFNSESKIVVPVKRNCMLENEDYLLNGKVIVTGKVVNVTEPNSKDEEIAIESFYGRRGNIPLQNNLYSRTLLDYLDYDEIDKFVMNRNKGLLSSYKLDKTMIEINNRVIEILPIAICI